MSDGIAYLVSQYPALSHTFIEREVQALRALGVPVSTYSVRSADRREPFPPATNSEVARTPVLQGNALGVYLGDLFHAARRSPVALLRTLIAALRLGPPGARARLWQVFYLVEAIRLLRLLERDGTARRIHVHHANNAADIARLTVMLARRVHPGDSRWRWTLGLPRSDRVPGRTRTRPARQARGRCCHRLHQRVRGPDRQIDRTFGAGRPIRHRPHECASGPFPRLGRRESAEGRRPVHDPVRRAPRPGEGPRPAAGRGRRAPRGRPRRPCRDRRRRPAARRTPVTNRRRGPRRGRRPDGAHRAARAARAVPAGGRVLPAESCRRHPGGAYGGDAHGAARWSAPPSQAFRNS